ncbi:TPA: IS3 family transposase, partial [Yersinia enterocolitica]|nr:IS3 family transposase [Yersinia enterocolitica]
MMPLINSLTEQHGVESVCQELAIAPSTFYWHRQRNKPPETRCTRDKRDDELRVEIQRVYNENRQVYGVRKVWRQLKRESITGARCTV